MSRIHVQEVEHHIRQLRDALDPVYTYVDETEHTISQLEESARQGREVLAQWEDKLRHVRSQIQSVLKPMEDAATVMQRELTHLEDLKGTEPKQNLDAYIRAVSSLLQLSVRMATVLFPPEQLKVLADDSTPYALEVLRQRWKKWLEELVAYLAQVIPLASSLVKMGDPGPLSQAYQQALQELGKQCRQIEVLCTASIQSQTGHEIEPPVMAHLKGGPLGNRHLFQPQIEVKDEC